MLNIIFWIILRTSCEWQRREWCIRRRLFSLNVYIGTEGNGVVDVQRPHPRRPPRRHALRPPTSGWHCCSRTAYCASLRLRLDCTCADRIGHATWRHAANRGSYTKEAGTRNYLKQLKSVQLVKILEISQLLRMWQLS